MIPEPESGAPASPDESGDPPAPQSAGGGWRKRFSSALVWQVLSLVGLIAPFVIASWVFPVVDWLILARDAIMRMGVFGAIVYPLFNALCNLLLLPAGVLNLGAGFCFGLWWGTLLVLIGNVVGAAAAFWIARKWARRLVEEHLLHRPRWAAFDRVLERRGWQVVVLSQLNPLAPTSLIHYMLGATRIRFWTCMLWVIIGQTPGRFLYVYLGTLGQYGVRILRGEIEPHPMEQTLWVGGIVVGIAATVALCALGVELWEESARQAEKPGGSSPVRTPETAASDEVEKPASRWWVRKPSDGSDQKN
jgi:uncharacterized membrane protein YdjX (TVP38/TMEM64 family)